MNAALRAALPTAGGLPMVVGCLATLGMTGEGASRFAGHWGFSTTSGRSLLQPSTITRDSSAMARMLG